jgi:hypothetical protein
METHGNHILRRQLLFRANLCDRDMEDVTQTTRGVKRRRSETSTPTTPSRLRLSHLAPQEENGEAPSGKRQKIAENGDDSHSQASHLQGKVDIEEREEDDDDDDFLARDLAEGGDTEDSDDSDSSS